MEGVPFFGKAGKGVIFFVINISLQKHCGESFFLLR